MKELIFEVFFYWGALLVFALMAWITWGIVSLMREHFRVRKVHRAMRQRR
jgi:hypothetical protein